jgi:hypothetical protein
METQIYIVRSGTLILKAFKIIKDAETFSKKYNGFYKDGMNIYITTLKGEK